MTKCYVCSRDAKHAINLGLWKPVCNHHYEEALEEETYGIMVRTIENHEAVQGNEKIPMGA